MTELNPTKTAIQSAQEALAMAELGFKDLKDGPTERRLPGFYNLVVWGRSFTNRLQHLRSIEQGFEIWYQKYVDQMQKDPLMRFFYLLRSEILKDGQFDKPSYYLYISKLRIPEDLGEPPKNAKTIFVGDQLGGVGWIVELPDGSEEKYYVRLPSTIAITDFFFSKGPESHLDQKISGESVTQMSFRYMAYLSKMLADCKKQFWKD